jgi:hypothetical protein
MARIKNLYEKIILEQCPADVRDAAEIIEEIL